MLKRILRKHLIWKGMGLNWLVFQTHQANSYLKAFTLTFFMEYFLPSEIHIYIFLPSSIKLSVQMSVPQKIFPYYLS